MNFDKVEEAQGGSMVMPGTKAIFTIGDIENGVSTGGKDFLKIKFESEVGSFSHYFYLSEGALSRVQHLWKHSHDETPLTGDVSIEGLIAGFKDKKVALKVTGRIAQNGKTYPDLAFGGFAAGVADLETLDFSPREQSEITAALANMQNQPVAQADTETSDTEAF